MLDKIEMPHDAKLEALQKVYEIAEGIYTVKVGPLPEGRTFSRGLNEDTEFCYQAAAHAYMHWIENGMPTINKIS